MSDTHLRQATAPSALLLEVGCEEIPARMIASAARDLAERVRGILDRAGLDPGALRSWGGARRLAVHVEHVRARQDDRSEWVVGPPATIAFDASGKPTAAAVGFARKQGVDPAELTRRQTDRGEYAAFRRDVPGQDLEQLFAMELPGAVSGMVFPKTMRWADGTHRWVRPVHWVVALHGSRVLSFELFGVASGRESRGHRFASAGAVIIDSSEAYEEALRQAHVVVDPLERRRRIEEGLVEKAGEVGGRPETDPELLAEVTDLVEWPGVVVGAFDEIYLELPRELLVTTLRHHQKCFAVQSGDGALLPNFLAVANTDRDPAGHVRRGNEWVVGGRLEDARFFWAEDRKRPLAVRSDDLERVVFHARCGSYGDKARRLGPLARALARSLDLDAEAGELCRQAAEWCKNDLVTGSVGEFPELQGQLGGLLLRAEGADERLVHAVYEHYRPQGSDDGLPSTDVSSVVAVADKLDTVAALIAAGEVPTGSKDPLGLRRATSGIFRIMIDRGWSLGLVDLLGLVEEREGGESLRAFLAERLQGFLRDRGHSPNEVLAVLRPRVEPEAFLRWPLPDVAARLEALGGIRRREDFALLVDLTKRVDNILVKNAETFAAAAAKAAQATPHRESEAAADQLAAGVSSAAQRIVALEAEGRYGAVIDLLAGLVDPVEAFFADVLVVDSAAPAATASRSALLERLRAVLTRCFDIRELAGQAERSV